MLPWSNVIHPGLSANLSQIQHNLYQLWINAQEAQQRMNEMRSLDESLQQNNIIRSGIQSDTLQNQNNVNGAQYGSYQDRNTDSDVTILDVSDDEITGTPPHSPQLQAEVQHPGPHLGCAICNTALYNFLVRARLGINALGMLRNGFVGEAASEMIESTGRACFFISVALEILYDL